MGYGLQKNRSVIDEQKDNKKKKSEGKNDKYGIGIKKEIGHSQMIEILYSRTDRLKERPIVK